MKKLLIECLIICLLSCNLAFSQSSPTDSVYFITTHDGSTINGTLHKKNEKEISIDTRNFGMVTIARDSIRQFQVLAPSSYKNGKFFFPNPNATRYFFSPSAIPLEKGEGYFQNTYLFFCSANYGLTKNISIGAEIDVLTPFISGSGGPIALASLKAGFKVTKNFYFAGTTLLVHTPYLGNESGKTSSSFMLEDAAFTIGNPDVNLTLGVGYGLNNSNWMRGPSFTLSGMARLTPRFSLVSENWVFPETRYTYNPVKGTESSNGVKYNGFISYGMRFMSQKIPVDFGFINNGDIVDVIFIGIPYVDFVVKF